MKTADTVLRFWFSELTSAQWFIADKKLDLEIQQRFLELHTLIANGGCSHWRADSKGRLAEILVLDQFSRNIFRNSAQAFACDNQALKLTEAAIALNADADLTQLEMQFLYMPIMHSESLEIHQKYLSNFLDKLDAQTVAYEMRHYRIIEKFGRYPSRNKILGRESTAEELEALRDASLWF